MNIDIARAWKDAQYRGTLTNEELAQLPENPVGALELTDNDLASVSGAYSIGVPGAASNSCCSGLGLNINLTGCCATGTGSAASPSPSSTSGPVATGYQGGSWHLSYVYDAGYSASDCCSTGYYTTCNVC
ncbi:mersacidin/lichenicidin family type 2 lantibiotic [Dictyobacter formicarum]|uniref:Mersacidin/lichenicidin family type 2 lantibiotic n=1 Tax=Dictyobacter formicarum TaxID=2778368 RepID=A0ABQ3V7F0_9CHLR|nr:mersacidin/lichenicidin family type 2 lantibiotic [Dictyobacter formicarum]GHO82067.1 hypothetical protein KSZ_00730 [Dictyobacter formicarum]